MGSGPHYLLSRADPIYHAVAYAQEMELASRRGCVPVWFDIGGMDRWPWDGTAGGRDDDGNEELSSSSTRAKERGGWW